MEELSGAQERDGSRKHHINYTLYRQFLLLQTYLSSVLQLFTLKSGPWGGHASSTARELGWSFSLPWISSGFFQMRHPKQQVQAFLGCSPPPPLSPAPLNWTPGSATLLKLVLNAISSYLSANELHQWLAGYGLKQPVWGRRAVGRACPCYSSASAPSSAAKKIGICAFSHDTKPSLKFPVTSWLCSWCFRERIYKKIIRITKCVTLVVFDPFWLMELSLSLLLRDFCFLFLQVTLTEEVRIPSFIAL